MSLLCSWIFMVHMCTGYMCGMYRIRIELVCDWKWEWCKAGKHCWSRILKGKGAFIGAVIFAYIVMCYEDYVHTLSSLDSKVFYSVE